MVDSATVARTVGEAVGRAASELRPDVLAALESAVRAESSTRGRHVLEMLIENSRIARSQGVPLCQDTGTVWVWVELGAEERLGGDLQSEVDAAVATAFRDGALRMSVARDALSDRSNTGDNTPSFIDVTTRPGRGASVHVMLKGGGSDNASVVRMLEPSAGVAGVHDVVVDAVRARAASACPPLVVGVGIGSTFDKVAALSKRALLREVGSTPASPASGGMERRLLCSINALGIGPGGFGGDTTALAVHVMTAPCHIATLPVAVNMGCCAVRSATVEVE